MSLKSKFCPKCGKEDKLVSGFCQDCFKAKTPIGEIPNKVDVHVCPSCQKYRKQGKWVKQTYIPGILKSAVRSALDLKGYGSVRIKINEPMTEAHVRIKWYMDENQESPKEESYLVRTKVNKMLCDSCFRKFGGYYESVIQLRGKKKDIMEAIDEIGKMEERGERWFISQIHDVRGGVDLHLGSKDMDRAVEQLFKKRVEEIKRSYSLVTKKDGRDVYRNTVLVRLS